MNHALNCIVHTWISQFCCSCLRLMLSGPPLLYIVFLSCPCSMPSHIFTLVHIFSPSRGHPSTYTQTNVQTTTERRKLTLICSTRSSGKHGNAMSFLSCDTRTTVITPSHTPVFFLYMPSPPRSALILPGITKSPERYVQHPNVYKATLPDGRRKKI